MVIDYKKVLLQNVMDCSGMGLDNPDEIIKQAIEWKNAGIACGVWDDGESRKDDFCQCCDQHNCAP